MFIITLIPLTLLKELRRLIGEFRAERGNYYVNQSCLLELQMITLARVSIYAITM
jgi:hypothetical protein